MKPAKPLLTILFCAAGFSLAPAEDSIPAYNLEEVTVEAARVIRKADMDVYHPSESTVDNSANGIQLINRLSIPALYVDEVMGKITAAGSEVQLRINGRTATVEQVRNLQPESIKRVEWIDNPGLRYNGASYVLNILVSNPSLGGSLMVNALQMFKDVFGTYNVDLKLNSGRSQWSIGTYMKPTVINKVHRDYREIFTFPSGQTLTRDESPLGGKVKNTMGYHSLSYSYIKPDTTIFYAQISSWNNYDNLSRFRGLLSLSDGSRDIHLLNQQGDKGYTPTLSLYLEQHLPHSQTLVMDFSASLFSGNSFTDYQESFPDADYFINDIHTYIKDLNQAYALEADYIKNWKASRLTAGLNYSANRNRSTYRYLDNAVFHQSQDKLYLFGEYFIRLGKFTLTTGMGAQYNSFVFKETDQGSSSWNMRPQATVTFSPNPLHQFRLNFSSWQTTPSLSETNVVPQQTDGFQWNVGNPNLKTYNRYNLNFRYSFNFWRINANFNINASTSPKAIAPYLYWEGDKLITSYENSIGKQSLAFSLSPQIVAVPNWLVISGNLEFLNERTRGKGYKLYNHNWNGNVSAILTHWNFTFMVQYNRAQRTLWGEKLSWGEDMSSMALLYKWKDWQFGAVMFMPFGKYDQGYRQMSKWNTNEYHMRLDLRMAGVMINYNLQWGKQKAGVNKLIDSDAQVEKSSAKSR